MKYKKEKNGVLVSVREWENRITLTDTTTGKVLAVKNFSNHITAIYFAKRLTL